MKDYKIAPRGERSGFKRIGITIPEDILFELKTECLRTGMDMCTFIRASIMNMLNEVSKNDY